ncbi:capsular biosynthesis protein, partial [Escherichia coli]
MNNKKEDCDVILYWVDSSDPSWFNEYIKYKKTPPNRFRDLGILKYVFRCIEYNMPWIRTVHFITNGQIPDWLNLECKRLSFHKHEDIFFFKEALPVFNSSAIEANFSNIPGLAERFILFNDDMLVINKVDESRFFVNDKPVDYIRLSYPRKGILYEKLKPQNAVACKFINNAYRFLDSIKIKDLNNEYLFNKNYTLRTNISNLIWSLAGKVKWFDIYHHPQPHTKSTWVQFRNKNLNGIIKDTSFAKFRRGEDINQYLYRFLNLCRGDFYPKEYNDHVSLYVRNVHDFEKSILKLSNKINFLCICEDENMSDEQ